MVSLRENAGAAGREGDALAERLCSFMQTHDLSLEDLAGVLRVQPQTLDHWLHGGEAPPACLLALMVLFETRSRTQGGAATNAAAPHGSAFHSPHELGRKAQCGEELLKQVRAI
jgi:transcriptional regulator with XRE-family HTH domain